MSTRHVAQCTLDDSSGVLRAAGLALGVSTLELNDAILQPADERSLS